MSGNSSNASADEEQAVYNADLSLYHYIDIINSYITIASTPVFCICITPVLLTIFVSYRRQGGLRSEYFKLVGMIVFNDLMSAIILIVDRIVNDLFGLWRHLPVLANVTESLFYLFAIPNFVLVLALAVQRFLLIFKPLTAKGLWTSRISMYCLVAAYVVTLPFFITFWYPPGMIIYFTEDGGYYTAEWNRGWMIHFVVLSLFTFTIGLVVLLLNTITIILMYRHRTKQISQSAQTEIRLSIQAIVLSINTVGSAIARALRVSVESGYFENLPDKFVVAVWLVDLCTLYSVIYTDPYLILCMSSVLRDEFKKQIMAKIPVVKNWKIAQIYTASKMPTTSNKMKGTQQ